MSAQGRPAGRPVKYDGEKLTPFSFRVTGPQRQKLEKLGGAKWLRKKIDAAKDPT